MGPVCSRKRRPLRACFFRYARITLKAFSYLPTKRTLTKRNKSKTIGKRYWFSQVAIARWEANLQLPNIEVAIAFVKYFNVTTDYFAWIRKLKKTAQGVLL